MISRKLFRVFQKKVLIKRETMLRLSTRLGRLRPDLLFSKGFVETNSVFRVRCLAACGAAYSPFFVPHANDLPHSRLLHLLRVQHFFRQKETSNRFLRECY